MMFQLPLPGLDIESMRKLLTPQGSIDQATVLMLLVIFVIIAVGYRIISEMLK